jgi:hypothetical protein
MRTGGGKSWRIGQGMPDVFGTGCLRQGWKRPTGRFSTVAGMFLADMSVDNFVPTS